LPLSDGDWIEVKQRLTVGEKRDAMQVASGTVTPDGSFRPNVSMLGVAQIAAYLVDWSFVGPDDKVVVIDTDQKRLAALRALNSATFDEIDAAIEQHILAMDAEDKDEKKRARGKGPSAATSPSAA